MKRKFILAFLGITVFGAVLCAQTLDEAILTAAITISRELPAGASVAVINFSSDSENLNEYALNELYGAILRNRSVIPVKPNQRQFQTIRDELNTAGELNSESSRSIGKLLGVQYLITGSIKQNGSLYNIAFDAVNLDAELKSQYQASLNPRSDMQLTSLLNIKPQSQPQPQSQSKSQSQSQSQLPAASTSQQKPVTIAAIEGITIPRARRTPVNTIIENAQYTGTITWSPAISEIFERNTQYTATITLTAKTGFTLQGVAANFFNVAGAISVSNNANTGVVTAVFPATSAEIIVITVNSAVISGVAVPVIGQIPITEIVETAQYRGTVTWSPAVSETFAEATQYTATIMLTEKEGYTFDGVRANFFKVAGATATNSEDSGIVMAKFPSTKDPEDAKLRTLGVSFGISYPTLVCTIHGTFTGLKNSFIELGVDAGWGNGREDRYFNSFKYTTEWFSLYPFANCAFFVPFKRTKQGKRAGGWYAGVGLGVMFMDYIFDIEQLNTTTTIWETVVAMNIVAGLNLGMFDISYTLQTDFISLLGKLSIGYVYRFK